MEPNRKVLIITYYWPPSGGVGVQRWMNFATQLAKRDWEPMILTPDNPQFEIKDEKLLDRVSHIPTIRIPIWEPFNLFHRLTGNKDRKNVQQGLVLEKSSKTFKDRVMIWIRGNLLIPDPRVFWVRSAAKKAIELIEREEIETIITTGPPHSIHLIGKKVKQKKAIKWIADFRDPWSKWDVLDKLNTSSLAKYIHAQLEKSVLEISDTSMTVSSNLAKAFGGIDVLNNGVTVHSNIEQEKLSDSTFTMGYYGMLNELRNPQQLWLMLDQMCRESPSFADQFHLRIGGIVAQSIKDEIGSLKQLKDRVTFLGYLPHEKMQEEYQKCNVLLLLLNKSSNSKWILPVKFFEYLMANRMILALGERKSDLGDLMNSKDIGELYPYSDIGEIRSFIEDVFDRKLLPNEKDARELILQFSHDNLTKKLVKILER